MVQFAQVVGLVQERADLPTVLPADRITRSTLVVLGERLAALHARTVMGVLRDRLAQDVFDEIARELPREYADLLDAGPAAGSGVAR